MNTQDYENLRKLISELQAQTHMICGEGYAAFNGLVDDIKENYICGLVSTVDRAKHLIEKIDPDR
ncbi:MAG TPA: hypothetical protein VGO51_15170 [Burkholderiaceae bacterium]|jgi:hypothetical protein|nr:hypothetical protein [Burkholderiaceae bacterium]